MTRLPIIQVSVALAAFGALAIVAPPFARPFAHARSKAAILPPPVLDVPAGGAALQTAAFAGGCFWGVQGVFEHVDGVVQAVSGYAGGDVADPGYAGVSSGTSGHAETVRVTFDPARVSYGKLLQIFFSVALDPTQVNRQGPDSGTQYRSELFVDGPEQATVARAYVAQLDAARVFAAPIATRIDPAVTFYPAEPYHQDYLEQHPDASYIAAFDMPRVQDLKRLFPENWQATPATVNKAAVAG